MRFATIHLREVLSRQDALADASPKPPTVAVSLFQEAPLDKIWSAREGRPSAEESRLRTSRFLTLVASGVEADVAAKQAKIGPWRALRIVTEATYHDVVQAIRDDAEAA